MAKIKEVNILLLGETGVGKSTWINGFHNYLKFSSLKHAMTSRVLHVLIPSTFTYNKDGEGNTIRVGEGGNESQVLGKSSTQEPRSYVFTVSNKRFRLIDTPGIGDTSGIEQDKKNMESILSYLTQFTEIHAICIFLKPNDTRLTVMFRFCIQELLVQLHNSAKNNIVFCFTNARQTLYQPGETLSVLNEELDNRNVGIKAKKGNCFCFDSESFRVLACTKNNIKFSKADIETFSLSWERSVKETNCLLNFVQNTMTPHKLRETIGMNEARRIIVAMSEPLAKVARTILQNYAEGEEVTRNLDFAASEISHLHKFLNFTGYDLVRTELDMPRTVCASPWCVRYIPIGESKVHNIIYDTVCHDKCDIQGVRLETVNRRKLRECTSMDRSGCCRICTHSYKDHIHVLYAYSTIEKEFFSPTIQDRINRVSDFKAKKETIRKEVQKRIVELRDEEQEIIRIGAKFGSFLKEHALLTYNDALSEYIDICIKEETDKPEVIRNKSMLEKMEKLREEYDKQVTTIDNAINQGTSENIKTAEEVYYLRERLCQLKHFGPTLKKMFEESSIERALINEVFVQPPEKKGLFGRFLARFTTR